MGTPNPTQGTTSFLGTVGYYQQYIANFAIIVRPLSRLTSKGMAWNWTKEEQEAFELLKARPLSAFLLGYPEADGEYILDTDAIAHGIEGETERTREDHRLL